jgi:hypothetical protein
MVYFDSNTAADPDGDLNFPLFKTMTFGVVRVDDPGNPKSSQTRLTYHRHGRTNSTYLRINGEERRFGEADGKWVKIESPKPKDPPSTNKFGGIRNECIWEFTNDKVQVSQIVEVVPGEPVESKGGLKRHLETVVVRYEIKNLHDKESKKIGLRFLLDTMIGFLPNGQPNDGVPFTVPGYPKLVEDNYDVSGVDKVPAFVEVLQNPDLKNPGIVARLNLKLGASIEAPFRVSLTRWTPQRVYDIPVLSIHFKDGDSPRADSAVALYWKEDDLAPRETRKLGFSYGLGSVASATGALGLTVGGEFTPEKEITVTAYVSSPKAGETVTLTLPDGLKLAAGQEKTQSVPAPAAGAENRAVPVTWRVVSTAPGTFELSVARSTSPGAPQKRKVQILKKSESIF